MQHHWYTLADQFCARHKSVLCGGPNPLFEPAAARRYNYATVVKPGVFRCVFLNDTALNPNNKTLVRAGRFIWCKNMQYEGLQSNGLRAVSFTVGKGKKRFTITEDNILCIPGSVFVSNNSFFKNY